METKAYIDQITKWYITEIFSAALPLTEAPQSLSDDVIFTVTSLLTVTSKLELWGLTLGVKQPKKSVTYHFVISAMQAFVFTKFHVVPKKGTLAYLCDVHSNFGGSVGDEAAEKISVTYHFAIWLM